MPFLIALLAGLSTLLGYFIIYLKNDNNRVLIASLGFASGVMFFISLFDLIPESFYLICNNYHEVFSILICLISINIGFIISGFINKYCPNNSDSNLYHVGIISMIGIIIHNIPEGVVTFLTSSIDLKLGIVLGIAITLHNIPEGISISIPIYYSTHSKKKAFIYTFVSGMSELLGAIIAFVFFKDISNDLFIGILYSIIAGIMFYISITELLPTSLKYKNKELTFISFVFGIFFIYISIFLLK